MKFEVKTINELLIDTFGNQSELARRLNINRATLRKYINDKEGKQHAIVNGIFMAATFESVHGAYENVPTVYSQQRPRMSAKKLRSYPQDVNGPIKDHICSKCNLLFSGHPLRTVCVRCFDNDDTIQFKKRLRYAGMKLNPVRY